MKKLKVAVTGGIGSGKSSLCSLFQNHGYTVLSSDLIAKDVMMNNAEVKKKIITHFGKDSYKEGTINKEYLAKKVFSDQEKTALINSIVHPATVKEIQKKIEKEFIKSNIVFVESALVYEAKLQKNFDYIILVFSDDTEKINRVTKRDSVSSGSVVERMNNQIPDEDKKTRADFIINNDSTLGELLKRGEFVLRIIESISKGD